MKELNQFLLALVGMGIANILVGWYFGERTLVEWGLVMIFIVSCGWIGARYALR